MTDPRVPDETLRAYAGEHESRDTTKMARELLELRAQLAQAEPVAWRCKLMADSKHYVYCNSDPLLDDNCPWDVIDPLALCSKTTPEHDRLAQWISVSERLPEESRQLTRNAVLAYFNWGIRRDELPSVQLAEISCGHWRPISGNGDFDQYVTHWMPLPSAPESEERKP